MTVCAEGNFTTALILAQAPPVPPLSGMVPGAHVLSSSGPMPAPENRNIVSP